MTEATEMQKPEYVILMIPEHRVQSLRDFDVVADGMIRLGMDKLGLEGELDVVKHLHLRRWEEPRASDIQRAYCAVLQKLPLGMPLGKHVGTVEFSD